LLRENALFLADDRVIPLLPRLLGKIFFNAKKYASYSEIRKLDN
jgi:ribosome biogenesis protein UTP30